VNLKLEYLAAMKSMRFEYRLSKENPKRELSTVTDKKSPIGHNMQLVKVLLSVNLWY
jgi:hypothetical protein